MNKKLLLPLFAFTFLSCSGEENADIASDFNDVTVSNFPVINGSYPYTSNVYTAVRSDIDRSSIAYRIFEFLTTEGGQAIVDESGYVPLQASSGVRALEQEAVKMEYHHSALHFLSSVLPQRIEIYDLSGKHVFQSPVRSRIISIPSHLSGCHIVNVWLDDDSFVQRKILL